jgi:hypothetical protein
MKNHELPFNYYQKNRHPANSIQLETYKTYYLDDNVHIRYCTIDGDLHYPNNKIWKLCDEDISLMVTFQSKKLNKLS